MKSNVFIEPLGLPGILQWPERANALIVFAHGSGSSRLSPRNLRVADALSASGMATFRPSSLRCVFFYNAANSRTLLLVDHVGPGEHHNIGADQTGQRFPQCSARKNVLESERLERVE